MSAPLASLPMYDWPEIREETDRLWSAIRDRFREAGFDAPERLGRDRHDIAHWRDPALLFSQTCGYPYATQLRDDVDLIGTPAYDVEGCSGPKYSSAVVVRADDKTASLEEAASLRFAFNSEDSLSGFRCLSPLIGNSLDFFQSSRATGGHRASARTVASGAADIAALDAVCWHLLQQVEPETARKLRVLQRTPLLPALPFVTRSGRPAEELEAMRQALDAAIVDISERLPVLRLRRVEWVDESRYSPLTDL